MYNTCEQCDQNYHTLRHESRYCSSACRQKAYRDRKRAEKHQFQLAERDTKDMFVSVNIDRILAVTPGHLVPQIADLVNHLVDMSRPAAQLTMAERLATLIETLVHEGK